MPQLLKDRSRLAPSVPFKFVVEGKNGPVEREYQLAFDFNALNLVEERTGFGLLDASIFARPSAITLSALLWGALSVYHDDEFPADDEGLQKVRAMLTSRNAKAAQDAVFAAYIEQMPDAIRDNRRKKAEVAEPAPEAPQVPAF